MVTTAPVHRRAALEERTSRFAADVRTLVRLLPRSALHASDADQLIRSSGSVGANYIEANECLGKNDFRMRIRISLKESKESKYWLQMIGSENLKICQERDRLIQEATELLRIFFTILKKIRAKAES